MPRSKPLLEEVAAYWDSHPVHSVEFGAWDGTAEYFRAVDRIRREDNERWSFRRFYEFSPQAGKRLLDAGCGIGFFTRHYAREGYDVHAVDLAPSAVRTTARSLALEGLPGRVVQASVEDLPFGDDSFDIIISNGVIHHTPDTRAAVDEFYRVLRPGGLASVCIYYRNILLRQPLWTLVRVGLPLLLKKKEGRSGLVAAATPEVLACSYDGDGTPIARIYTRPEALGLFSRFDILAAESHYFPVRFLRLCRPGGLAHRFLDKHLGLLIYLLLRKA
jgi:SAM-dependent methyltransferase